MTVCLKYIKNCKQFMSYLVWVKINFTIALRKLDIKAEQFYNDVLHMAEYAGLPGHQQLIFREGLTRMVCIHKAYLINEPEKVPKECQNYSSYL